MKINVPITAAVAAAAAAAGLALMPTAGADTTLGQQGRLTNGDVVQAWTISDLKVSTDQLPYQPKGTLWEATATDEAIQGSVIPIVANFNAKANDGETYRVLYGVASAQGVNPGTLSQGEKTTGKIYFDVTGANPETVTYTSGDEDLLTWKAAPATSTAPTTATPAPAAVPAGSQGTPLPAGSQGTPVDEQAPAATPTPTVAPVTATPTPAPATPTPGAEGTPLNSTAVPASPAPATATPAVPVPEGAAPQTGTPPVAAVPGVPAVPASDSVPHGQRAAGSQGTPVSTEG
ncbi:immunogenic protein MPT63 [Mycobacteroides abscessus subsp. abscessus]|uniref:MPT63 family protein n=1 Tax=Mycobacteroides abscessus TaxID=36809 RepID=UPI00092C07F6|nr:MPT63 family protein [Mycobacteroides abscessus]SIB96898.1 immunogenic protein MPT63 [Mycobacteroides abscessus subsp. abscessus]